MKAIVQERYGSPDVLGLRELPRPSPVTRTYSSESARRVSTPTTGTSSAASRTSSTSSWASGSSVRPTSPAATWPAWSKRWAPRSPGSSRATRCMASLAAADSPSTRRLPEKRLAVKPAKLSFEQAAAVPMAALTALAGLRGVGRIQAGQHVLVNGASGGVGTFAVQIAKAHGAEVTGVCSTGKLDLVRSIGADHVIDYTKEDFTKGGRALRPHPRHGRLSVAPQPPPRAHPQGSARDRWRRWGGTSSGPSVCSSGRPSSRRSCGQRLEGVSTAAMPEGLDYLRPS